MFQALYNSGACFVPSSTSFFPILKFNPLTPTPKAALQRSVLLSLALLLFQKGSHPVVVYVFFYLLVQFVLFVLSSRFWINIFCLPFHTLLKMIVRLIASHAGVLYVFSVKFFIQAYQQNTSQQKPNHKNPPFCCPHLLHLPPIY